MSPSPSSSWTRATWPVSDSSHPHRESRGSGVEGTALGSPCPSPCRQASCLKLTQDPVLSNLMLPTYREGEGLFFYKPSRLQERLRGKNSQYPVLIKTPRDNLRWVEDVLRFSKNLHHNFLLSFLSPSLPPIFPLAYPLIHSFIYSSIHPSPIHPHTHPSIHIPIISST